MRNSRIDPDYIFDSYEWAVSIVNVSRDVNESCETRCAPGGHAMLVVEGELEADELFVGMYDIDARTDPEAPHEWYSNTKGQYAVKCKDTENPAIRDHVLELYDLHYLDRTYHHETYLLAVTDVKRMIDMIRQEARIFQATEDTSWQELPFSYQRWGDRSPLTQTKDGDSCIGWCVKKLQIAKPDYQTYGLKDKPPKPPWCVIL